MEANNVNAQRGKLRAINALHFNALNNNQRLKMQNLNANEDKTDNKNLLNSSAKPNKRPVTENGSAQDNLSAKMLRMGALQLPGLVPVQEPGVYVRPPVIPTTGQLQQPQLQSLPTSRTGSPFLSVDPTNPMSNSSKPFPDAVSLRSLASIGMGSTDGKRMVIRKVPTSPVELLNIVNPPS